MAKGKITAYAPAKAILFGEHYVVWGAGGIACGIEPMNRVELEFEAGAPSFEYATDIGRMKCGIDGKLISGEKMLAPAAAVYSKACAAWRSLAMMKVRAKAIGAWNMKGVGNSASFSAALACALSKAASGAGADTEGTKGNGADEIFAFAQESDRVAHGGNPSGIDASAVSRGGALEVRKEFSSPPKFKFVKIKFKVPEGWKFLVVDTHVEGTARASTAEQIEKFARAHGMSKAPGEAGAALRKKVTAEYDALFASARAALASGDMEKVGALMNENHALLRIRNVSCARIEEAVSLALANGAAGAKLSGAGGEGSAVLVLAQKNKFKAVSEALSNYGFAAREFRISEKGAHCGSE